MVRDIEKTATIFLGNQSSEKSAEAAAGARKQAHFRMTGYGYDLEWERRQKAYLLKLKILSAVYANFPEARDLRREDQRIILPYNYCLDQRSIWCPGGYDYPT